MLTLYTKNDPYLRRRFLALPMALYPPERRAQEPKTERQLLEGKHPLSPCFEVYPFLALDGDRPVARCLLTIYPEDDAGYVGFFESEDIAEAASLVLNAAYDQAKRLGKRRLVGPYNASFWIGYRFKSANFRDYFTGEPCNRPYYPRLWEKCGFTVTDHYYSNHMRVPTAADVSRKAVRRLEQFRAGGYEFRNPTFATFDTCLREIYHLLTALYSTFPGYKPITEAQFVALYGSLRYVVDFEMVKLAYKDDRLAAFVICVPNYGVHTAGKITLKDFKEILRVRRRPTEYSIPYMGVAPEHAGLGNALSELLKQDLMCKNCTSISALIHDGKVSGGFYKMLLTHRSEYVLMERVVHDA